MVIYLIETHELKQTNYLDESNEYFLQDYFSEAISFL